MKLNSPRTWIAAAVLVLGASAGTILLLKSNNPKPAAMTMPASPLASDVKSVHPLRAALNQQKWQDWIALYDKQSNEASENPKAERYRNQGKEEAIKILNSFLDSGNSLPTEGLDAIRKILLAETFHESGPSRKLSVLSAHVLSKLPAPGKTEEKQWLEQVKQAQTKSTHKDQIFIWIEASSGWDPFPSQLASGLKKYFNKDDFQSDAIYLIQKIKDPKAKSKLIAELLKSKKSLKPEYRKIVEERFKQ